MSHHGQVIRFLRTRRDWTQEELARRIRRSREQVARHEAGVQGLGPRTLARYAAAFRLSVREFAQLCTQGLDRALGEGEGVAGELGDAGSPGGPGSQSPARMGEVPWRDIPFFPGGIPAGDRRFFRPGELHSEHQIPRVLAEALRLPYHDIYACRVVGDSMEPSIRNGEVVLLSSQPVRDQGVISGMVYALWYNEHLESSGQLKRVKILSDGRWLAQSDNPRYPPRVIEPAALAGMDMYLGTIGLTLGAGAGMPSGRGNSVNTGSLAAEDAPREGASLAGGGAEAGSGAEPAKAPAPALQQANGGIGPIRTAAQIGPVLKKLKKRAKGRS